MPTTCSTIVIAPEPSFVPAVDPETGSGNVALSRPIRRDAPPANTTPANAIGWVDDCATSGDGPGVAAAQQRLQRCRVAGSRFLRGANLRAGRVVVGRPGDLPENSHHGVLEVLVGQPR